MSLNHCHHCTAEWVIMHLSSICILYVSLSVYIFLCLVYLVSVWKGFIKCWCNIPAVMNSVILGPPHCLTLIQGAALGSWERLSGYHGNCNCALAFPLPRPALLIFLGAEAASDHGQPESLHVGIGNHPFRHPTLSQSRSPILSLVSNHCSTLFHMCELSLVYDFCVDAL